MNTVTMPDFKRIAETVKHEHFNTSNSLTTLIEVALLDAFSKGYSSGRLSVEDSTNVVTGP